jgi:hypothetical protein
LVDLTFVARVQNDVWMGLRGVDESLFPIIPPRLMGEVLGELQRPTAIYNNGSKTEGLVEIGIFLDRTVKDCLDTVVFSLLRYALFILLAIYSNRNRCGYNSHRKLASEGLEGLKATGISYRTNDMLFRTRRSLRYLGELGYDIYLMWIPSHMGIQGNKRANVLANEGSIFGTLFQDQAGLTTVNTSDIYTRPRTSMLTERQER